MTFFQAPDRLFTGGIELIVLTEIIIIFCFWKVWANIPSQKYIFLSLILRKYI